MSLTKVSYSMIAGAPANVADYIPAGTNTVTTNCAPFINAAIAARKFVYLPAGTYRVDTTIDLKTYPQSGLVGESSALVIIKAGASMTQIIDLYDTADINGGNEYVIENLILDGNSLSTYGVNIRHRHFLNANNVITQNCTTGWWMADSWINNFDNCVSRDCATGFYLEGANHTNSFSNCYITEANTTPLYVGGISRPDGNEAVVFNNLLIDHCNATQIVVDLGSTSPAVVSFNGGYFGEFASNTGSNSIVQVLSGAAVFTGVSTFTGEVATYPNGMSLFRRTGGEAIFKNCHNQIQDYNYIYHPSSTSVGSLTIQDCKVTNVITYANKLISGLYNAFTVRGYTYKLPSVHFGRSWQYNLLGGTGTATQSFVGSEAQKVLCTSTGPVVSFTTPCNPIPDGTKEILVFIEITSNILVAVNFDSGVVFQIPSTAGVRSTYIGIYLNGSAYTSSPTTLGILKDAGAALNTDEYIQIHKISLIPIVASGTTLVSFES